MNNSQLQATLDPNTYQELESLRGKLWSLQETFSSHLTFLKEPKYPFTWPDLLNKFNMLTAKFATLSEDFYSYTEPSSNATLPKLMVHPYIPTTTETETNILSVLLRTKLIPDIEKLEAETQLTIAQEMLADGAAANNSDSNSNSNNRARDNIDDEKLIQDQLQQWKDLLQRHDRLAADAAHYVTDLTSDHRHNFLLRYEDLVESEEEDEGEDVPMKEEKEWEKMGFPSEEAWKRWKLECIMNFYSSGKSELQGSDLKRLASQPKK